MSELSNIPARGAARLEWDRMIKAGILVGGAVLALRVAARFYKPILAVAAVAFVSSRPPVKRALEKAGAVLRRDGP